VKVILGFTNWPNEIPACPYCGYRYYCLEDDGHPEAYLVRCWCGAKCRLRKDEPDLPLLLACIELAQP
jgi:hypothetical protein